MSHEFCSFFLDLLRMHVDAGLIPVSSVFVYVSVGGR